MFSRTALFGICLLATSPVAAEELGAQQSVSFVEEKLFAYTCFNGVAGEGRILGDGSVVGNFQPPDSGQKIFATLPPGTIRVEEGAVCARVAGLFFRPCFKVDRLDDKTFRGSIAGLDFAYCVFHQVNSPTHLKSSSLGSTHEKPVVLKSLKASTLY